MLACSVEVEHGAFPFESNATELQPEIGVPFAVNLTVPVGVIDPLGPLMDSVNVTVALRPTDVAQSGLVGSVEVQVRLLVAVPKLTVICTAELGELA